MFCDGFSFLFCTLRLPDKIDKIEKTKLGHLNNAEGGSI